MCPLEAVQRVAMLTVQEALIAIPDPSCSAFPKQSFGALPLGVASCEASQLSAFLGGHHYIPYQSFPVVLQPSTPSSNQG